MAKHPTSLSPPSDANLAALIRDGFVVLPEYHDREKILALRDALLPKMEQVRREDYPSDWDCVRYSEDGIYRLRNVQMHCPDVSMILNDAYTREVATAYLGEIRRCDNYLDYKPDCVHDHTTQLHMDSWQSQIKVFTLMCDVGPGNAPLAYWPGTHRDLPWRRRFEYLNWIGDEVGISGAIPPGIVRNRGYQEVEVTARAGTVIIADTRGVHRASSLREGYRMEVVEKYSAPVVL